MSLPQMPKYQAIYAVLRQQILDGELAPGSQLPRQQDLAERFDVTLMTLRQAVAALAAEGLVRAEHGKGTFVAERPVDISVGNLSSFAAEMRSAGIAMSTEVLGSEVVASDQALAAATALQTDVDLLCITRLRSVAGQPFGLQRSYLTHSNAVDDRFIGLAEQSLYDAIETTTGSSIAQARESISAVGLSPADAKTLRAQSGEPALLSVRTSISQFGQPFLYDEALLVGDRCTIAADRSSDRLSLHYGLATEGLAD